MDDIKETAGRAPMIINFQTSITIPMGTWYCGALNRGRCFVPLIVAHYRASDWYLFRGQAYVSVSDRRLGEAVTDADVTLSPARVILQVDTALRRCDMVNRNIA